MPSYLINAEVWKSLWPIVLVALGLASFVALLVCMNKQGKELFRELFFVLTAFAMLGMVTGYLSGFSREPALGAVLPAVLSLMGGLAVFLVGKNAESRVIVGTSVFLFAVTLLIGAEWGAVMRDTAEEYKVSEDYLRKKAFIEAEVNEFRSYLDLLPLQLGDGKAAK